MTPSIVSWCCCRPLPSGKYPRHLIKVYNYGSENCWCLSQWFVFIAKTQADNELRGMMSSWACPRTVFFKSRFGPIAKGSNTGTTDIFKLCCRHTMLSQDSEVSWRNWRFSQCQQSTFEISSPILQKFYSFSLNCIRRFTISNSLHYTSVPLTLGTTGLKTKL